MLPLRLHCCRLLPFIFLLWSACGDNGGFIVDGGIFPLPAVHTLLPLPSLLGLRYEDVRLTTTDGQQVYGWYIPCEGARATVLVHHGAVSNRSTGASHYLLFHELGCAVFAYDYQGFGESWRLASLDTILPDADAALAYVQQRARDDGLPVVVYGASLGTLPTFVQASRGPAGVAGIIVEGSCVPQALPSWAFYLVGIVPSPEAALRIPQELDPETQVAQVALPKLFVQSRGDSVMVFAGAERLYHAAPEPKELYETTGEHLLAVLVDPNYRAVIAAYLDRLLGSWP